MKKLTELTLEEKRILAAEACGWRYIGSSCFKHQRWDNWTTPEGWTGSRKSVPDYGNDLNACAEMQATLTEDEHHAFRCYLWDRGGELEMSNRRYERSYFESTAAQRLDAFLLAKGLAE